MSSKRRVSIFQQLFLILCVAPVLSINLGDYHDWGGDFALYIQQAINLVEGIPQDQTHYIFNPFLPLLSPPSYGVGFPLLLAPAYWLFGNDIFYFVATVNLFYLGLIFLIFKLVRREFNYLESFLISVGLAYTPDLLAFKGEVLSDIPFAFFIALSLYLYPRAKKSNALLPSILLGLCIGYAMLIRSIGAAMLLALLFDQFGPLLKRWESSSEVWKGLLRRSSTLVLSSITFYFLMSSVVFPTEQDGFSFFSDFFFKEPFGDQVRKGLEYAFLRTEQTFFTDADKWQFLSYLNRSFIIAMLLIGFTNKVTSRLNHCDIFFIIYMAVLILYPVFSQGFRYMLPLLPIGCCYVLTGFNSIKMVRKQIKPLVYIFFGMAIYYAFEKELDYVKEHYPKSYKGSRTSEAQEVYNFIQNSTAPEAIFVFNKPRVLGLYAQRDAYALKPESNEDELKEQLEILDWDYVLLCSELNQETYNMMVDQPRYPTQLVFENQKFKLYKNQSER